MKILKRVQLTPDSVSVDGVQLPFEERGAALPTAIYRSEIGDWPKFFKMDALCKVGVAATELLLRGHEVPPEGESRAVVLCGRTSSLVSDSAHTEAIAPDGEFLPRPSVFVYTLPNIVTGEIAIRHKYYGETSFLLFPTKDMAAVEEAVALTFLDPAVGSVVGGWVDCSSPDDFDADVFLAEP